MKAGDSNNPVSGFIYISHQRMKVQCYKFLKCLLFMLRSRVTTLRLNKKQQFNGKYLFCNVLQFGYYNMPPLPLKGFWYLVFK